MSIAEYRKTYGCRARRPQCQSPEEILHRACFALVRSLSVVHPVLAWVVHVPNGGKRPRGEAGKLKAMGVRAGFPDLFLPRRHQRWTGLAIELKSASGRVSHDQAIWLEVLASEGYLTAVCRTLGEFDAALHCFLDGTQPLPSALEVPAVPEV